MRYLVNFLRQAFGSHRQREPASGTGGDVGALAGVLRSRGISISFNLIEIGALPIEGQVEPFYQLLKLFPASHLSAFEINPALCEKLNRRAEPNIRYFPCALGRTAETRRLYETMHPMCTSLYEPDERYAEMFNNLDDMRLKTASQVETMALDRFVADNALGAIDFIKIDVQGAELEIFHGGVGVLRDLLMLVCEVEFVPMYRNQPLFADVDAFLRQHGFMLHRFLGMAGRVMKPLMVHGSRNYPVQFLWSDAAYIRDLFAAESMSAERLLKLAVLLDLYDSKDVALYMLRCYDKKRDTDIARDYQARLNAGGVWKSATA
jgi:FkbM family methyltransferase